MQTQQRRYPPPNPRGSKERKWDRPVEDLRNIVMLEHVNVTVPEQVPATLFYVTGLGLTRDPYLMTGVTNMWVNVGRSQFHLPSGKPQVLRGSTGIVMPDRAALLQGLETVRKQLDGTRFAVTETADYVEATCPWGNRIRIHEPAPEFDSQFETAATRQRTEIAFGSTSATFGTAKLPSMASVAV